jgi:membrane dipeptidase
MPSEQDPLLPQDKGAPEIIGSRAPSIYGNNYIGNGETTEDDGSQSHQATRSERSYKFLMIVIVIYFALLVYLSQFIGDWRPAPKTLEERVNRILSDTPLIGTYSTTPLRTRSNCVLDGHNDFPILIRSGYHGHIYDPEFTVPFEQGGLSGHVDLPRLAEGKNGGAFWSVYAPCPANGSDFSDENYAASKYHSSTIPCLIAFLGTLGFDTHLIQPFNTLCLQ